MSAITRYNATVTITREQSARIPPPSRNRFVFVARSVTPPPPTVVFANPSYYIPTFGFDRSGCNWRQSL